MLALLQYIFSSFWVFSGTVILVFTIGVAISMIIVAIRGGEIDLNL